MRTVSHTLIAWTSFESEEKFLQLVFCSKIRYNSWSIRVWFPCRFSISCAQAEPKRVGFNLSYGIGIKLRAWINDTGTSKHLVIRIWLDCLLQYIATFSVQGLLTIYILLQLLTPIDVSQPCFLVWKFFRNRMCATLLHFQVRGKMWIAIIK